MLETIKVRDSEVVAGLTCKLLTDSRCEKQVWHALHTDQDLGKNLPKIKQGTEVVIDRVVNNSFGVFAVVLHDGKEFFISPTVLR